MAAWLLVGAVMTMPPAAAAQDREPTPSAGELWKTYPLRPDSGAGTPAPEPTAGATARPAPSRTASARSSAPDDDGTPLPLLGGAAVLAALGAAFALRRRSSRRPGAPALAMPLLAAAATTAALPEKRRQTPRLTALAGHGGGRDRRGDDDQPVEALRPPDPEQPWTAELEWRDEGDGPRFCVTAHPVVGGPGVRIATSAPLEWPPPDAVAVQRLRRTVARMEAAVRDVGWAPQPPGEAWYAKRFAWTGIAAPASAPAPTGAPARESASEGAPALPPEAPTMRRFEPQPPWPPGTERLWRCEIRWRPGYVNSRFTVVAREPGRRGTTTLASSKAFKWLIMADPEPQSPEFRSAAERLDEAITAAGWEPAGCGVDWWARRYVWRGDGAPPLKLDPALVRIGDTDGGDDDED